MNLEDLRAVIESAKARGREPLDKFLHERLPEATPAEIDETAEVAIEIIESVPLFLAAAEQAAVDRNLSIVVEPLLERASRYFLHPIDLIPEMTQGLAGLLDDAYLVLRILKNLEQGPEPLVDWDLDYPIAFLRRLVGERIGEQLDAMSLVAFQEVSGSLELWQQMSHDA